MGKKHHDYNLLEGTQSVVKDYKRTSRIANEFLKGFKAFKGINDCITVFGSARFGEDHKYYKLAMEMGGTIADNGFKVMTGGGPGIMEAANRGAKEAGGESYGCNIILPMEQHENPYLDKMVEFKYFFSRKVMLIKYSCAFVLMPGGFGTMDEIFETLTLIQTEKIRNFPIVCMGTEYWQGLMDFVRGTMVEEGTISKDDLKLVFVTDDPQEAIEYIQAKVERRELIKA
ncbi:LOG family protein [Aureibacter tunicatorum]|uniref:Cytokinin riboside 5'-monophosphate phosphoribohydrolase n=1 Tax=Aureibacter tunicatorum TaxID=866807 RepID=A0AAE3XT04_9BACT|nr:TIGR00730 family Rossman fold protein [Aureibacter tunicatorum]MDR6241553.1 hypothetical protein [Aureibacter tunicatorum]BDD07223.1 cytokinin riboside 5'-monophosphate phosphoribohydrolase [Aureibacter tunicatorum]